jgi:signal transduction histidine kinase
MIDPNVILKDVLSKIRGKIEQAGATIEISELPSLNGDPLLFSILMSHLLDNALKFRKLAVSTVIRIKYSRADEMNAVAGAIRNMPYTIISIADNGVGFREEDAEKIFELFVRIDERGRYKGSGIGLAVCRKIMTMHGGFITAESEPAHGSVFNCYFPRDIEF